MRCTEIACYEKIGIHASQLTLCRIQYYSVFFVLIISTSSTQTLALHREEDPSLTHACKSDVTSTLSEGEEKARLLVEICRQKCSKINVKKRPALYSNYMR